MRQLLLTLVFAAIATPVFAQPTNRVDYRLSNVHPFVVDSATQERTYADSIAGLIYRNGEYLDRRVRFEMVVEQVSDEAAEFTSLRVERYILVRSRTPDAYGAVESEYPDLTTDQPVWIFDRDLYASIEREAIDDRTDRLVTGPIQVWKHGRKRPIGYTILGYAVRFYVTVPNVSDRDVTPENNATHIDMMYYH